MSPTDVLLLLSAMVSVPFSTVQPVAGTGPPLMLFHPFLLFPSQSSFHPCFCSFVVSVLSAPFPFAEAPAHRSVHKVTTAMRFRFMIGVYFE